ncbi:MAG: hemerythrin domain-containing protein [Reichenbachiella sp.]
MQNKSIKALIDENYIYAKVMDYFGVEFHQSSNKTLQEVCEEKQIDLEALIANLIEKSKKRENHDVKLKDFPAILIVEYLKHSHQIFVKDTLPYLMKLTEKLADSQKPEIINDLKLVIPMFVEDFIHHIYEEEDKLFAYVSELENFVNGRTYSSAILNNFEDFSLEKFAMHHKDSDDEMAGIRGITANYDINSVNSVGFKVLMQELQAFDKELKRHASIENDILLPKAQVLVDRAAEMTEKKKN